MTPKIINNHINEMRREFPLSSKFQLKILLQEWLKTSGNTVGDLKGKTSNPKPLIWIKTNNNLYFIPFDTKRKGVELFVENEDNKYPWVIIPTEGEGNLTKVTNDKDGRAIPLFYMYKSQ